MGEAIEVMQKRGGGYPRPVCVDITHCVAQAGLRHKTILLPPECWDHSHRHNPLNLNLQMDACCPVPCKLWLPPREEAWGGESFLRLEHLSPVNCDCDFDLPNAVTVVTIVDMKVLRS